MSKWPMTPLGEVLSQYKQYIEAPESKEYPKLSVRLYGKGVTLDAPVNGSALRMKRHQIARSGQVILSEIWGKKGAVGFVPPEGDGALCTSHFFLFDVHRDKLEPKYLQAIFTANYLEDQLDVEAKGTTGYAAVRPKNLLASEIPLPPLPEQRRIVSRIESLTVKIEVANGLRQKSVEEGQALINATRRSIIGDSPKNGWKPLHFFVKQIVNGKSPACDGRAANEGEWGVLKVGAVSFGYFKPKENKALPLSFKPPEEFEVKSGDFLMSRANTAELVGACAVVKDTTQRLMLSDKIFRFTFRDEQAFLPDYLNHVMKSPALREQIIRGATGTSPTMKNISKEKVFNLLVPHHPLPEQRRIVAYLDQLQSRLGDLRKFQTETSAELDALLPSVLDKAFKGEL